MKKEDIKLIIFDMDGVILDSEPLHENARRLMFEELGIVPDDRLPDPVGKSSSGFWRTVIQVCGMEGEPYALEAEQYRLVAKQIEEHRIGPSDGLMEILEWAKGNGCEIGLASSSTRILVDDALRLLGVSDYFDYTVSGNEVNRKKPAPDVYLRVLEKAGLRAGQAVAVEDSKAGVEAAEKAGIFCYGYVNETSGRQDVSKANRIIYHLKKMLD